MATTYTVAAYGERRGVLASAASAAFEEARRVDRLLSNYKPESELSRINREASEGPVRISREMAGLLARCLEYSRAGRGAFDITVGPLMDVWGFFRGEGRVPWGWQIRRALARTGYQHIGLDREARTVRFLRDGMELDPGGIGKGYAVDRMIGILKKAGVESAFVSAGSSSLYGLGAPPGEPQGWKVSIRDPRDENKTAAEARLRDMSLSTSGSYEKFFAAGGKTYSHIMDPRTGWPAEGMLSVSVLAPSTLDSEAWTKIFFVQGAGWSRRHAPSGFRVFLCPEDEPCSWIEK